MTWNNLTLNPKVMLGYYDQVPTLKDVEIVRINLLQDGPTAEIVFEPKEFPTTRSSKWPAGANACQITLRAFALSEIAILHWTTSVIGDLKISAVPQGVEVLFQGKGSLRFVCLHIDVAKVIAYLKEDA